MADNGLKFGPPGGVEPLGGMVKSLEQALPPFDHFTAEFKQLAQTLVQLSPHLDKFPTELSGIIAALGPANAALIEFEATAKEAFGALAQGIGQAAAASLVEGQNIGKAIEQATKEVLKQIASQSLVKALYETGYGFADLAIGDFADAALHFEAAAIFGSIGAVAGGLGAAIPGGGAGARGAGAGARAYGGRAGGGYGGGFGGYAPGSAPQFSLAPGSQAPPPGGNLQITVIGPNEAAQWFSDQILNPYVQRGGTLYATQTTRSPYSGG